MLSARHYLTRLDGSVARFRKVLEIVEYPEHFQSLRLVYLKVVISQAFDIIEVGFTEQCAELFVRHVRRQVAVLVQYISSVKIVVERRFWTERHKPTRGTYEAKRHSLTVRPPYHRCTAATHIVTHFFSFVNRLAEVYTVLFLDCG